MPSLICAECGHANGGEARFCEECGSSLAPRCASCGAEVSATARFCSSCGSPIADQPAATGALKVVSVVFSDVVGSTELQEKLEPESVRRVMARFYEAMRKVVEDHGGAIQKFIGDAVVAVFGVPSVSEDDALRAVRCAVAMTETLAALNDELEQTWGVRLETRTGVNTGELAISGEGIFVGDTMNTAARLEQAADAGQVLLGEATWRLVRHEIEVEEIAPLELKGKAGRVRVWRVESVQPRGPAAAEAPLVGRASELDRLRAALDQAITAQACRLVTVIASPGLGKSRLAAEFARSLDGEATVLEGHCEQSGEGITFLPVADVLRAAASIADDDDPEQVVAKLTETVPDGPDRERIVARVAGLLGAAPPAAPEETFWGVRTVLESLARERPLVVVLDDVHWGQPMFLDLIEHLVEWARDASILLLALARPELRETRGALAAAGRRAADVIELHPLGPDQSRELVGGLLGQVDVPDELLERILETTEGNPLFLGELLRMLVEEGSLARDGDVWVAAGGAETVQVPPTIQALLTARIERLRADERSVVERASVIGKQFYRGAVAELVTPPVRSDIDGHLETLRRKDMVEPEGTYWIDEPVYRFHHVLIRDAAYHLLLKEARAELHEKFADWLETKAGALVGEHEEVIAYHLEQAHEYRRQLGPLDEHGKAVGSRAAERLASAGRRALAREDLAAAANLLQRALDREAGGGEDEMLWSLGEALLSAGDTAGAGPVVDRLSGPRGDVLGAQLSVLTGTGSLEETVERVSAATSALAEAGDPAAEAKGHHVTAQVQAQLGRVADVETSLDHALLAARKADDRRRITAVLAAAPRAALWGPSPVVRASGRCLDVVRILRMTPGNRHVEAVALRCQAVLEAMRGRADAAREILAGGRATLEELGLTLELHELAMHAGIVELLAGQPARAEELLRTARDGFALLGVSVSAAQAAAMLARALIEQGRDEDALAETEFAEQHAGGDLKTTITWLGVRAEAIARRGQTDDALALARRATALAEPTDALADKADANMALARVLREAGQPDEARRAAEAARALYEAKDHAVGLQRARELDSRATPAAPKPETVGSARINDPQMAAVLTRYAELWADRDLQGLTAMHAPDWIGIDHRRVGWGEQSDIEPIVHSVLAAAPDIRFDVDEVLDSAPGVIAIRAKFRGHSSDTGGEIEVPIAYVVTVRDGQLTRSEEFEPEAETSIRACFDDLRGRMLLGDRPPERLYERFVDCFGRHDRDGLAEIWSSDIAFVDHRQIAWEELHGVDALLKLADSAFQMAHDIRCVVDEVIACDDRVLAVRSRYLGSGSDGGGPIELPAGTVNVIESGRVIRSEWFATDDREGMLARYRELGGTFDVLGDRPPERLWAEFKRRFDAHDLDGLLDLYAEDWRMTDHRQLGMDVIRDPAAFHRSVLDASTDVRADVETVLACDERVIALTGVYRGSAAEHGGEFEIPFASVVVVENELARSTDVFDPDDRIAIMARWRELHGLGLLGDHRPERFWAKWIDCFARRDVERVRQLLDDDYTFVDRRSIGWEAQLGPEEHLKAFKSGLTMFRFGRFAIDEVLACDESVCAVRGTYVGAAADGGGEVEVSVGYVGDFTDRGFRRVEQFEHDDTEAMLARYRELGGAVTVLGDRPAEQLLARHVGCFNAHDVEGLADLVTEDFVTIDNRPAGIGTTTGRDHYRSALRSIFDGTHARVAIDEVLACDDNVIAVRTHYSGVGEGFGAGEFDLLSHEILAVRDGRFLRLEHFDPDDRQAMIARYAELGGGASKLGDRPPELVSRKFVRAFGTRDLEYLAELVTDDYVLADRRGLGWEELTGRDAWLSLIRSSFETTLDNRVEIDEVLACDDRVLAAAVSWKGTATPSGGGGPFEYKLGQVSITEDGRIVRTDQYDHDDREAMLARFAELGGASEAVLGERPPERVWARYIDRFNASDFDALEQVLAPDYEFEDHRTLGGEPARGVEGGVEILRWARKASADLRIKAEEVLACDERVIAFEVMWSGPGVKAGEFEVPMGVVAVIDQDRLQRHELFNPDDRQTMIARYLELGGGLGKLGQTGAERICAEWLKRYAARDLKGLLALNRPDFVVVDHRQVGWPELDNDGYAEQMQSGWQSAADIRMEVDEVLAADDRALALILAFRGSARVDIGGGRFELQAGIVILFDGERGVRAEWYDPDDRGAMLARYRELGGTRSVLDHSPSVRLMSEVQRVLNARNYERLAELVAGDWYFVDHRALGWEEAHGRDQCVAIMRSMFDPSPDVRFDLGEPLAADDRLMVVQAAIRGHGRKAGEHETITGAVYLIEDGLWAGVDFYEPDDQVAMITRYAELGGGAGPLGDRPPERFFKKWLPLSAANDAEALSAMLAEDFVRIDHRSIGWEPLRGRDANVTLWRSAYETAEHIRQEVEEVLACDDRVIAYRFSWRGVAVGAAGEFATSVGQVNVIEDGLWISCDQYDTDDREAMLARYAELRGGREATVGDRPPERFFAEYARIWAAADRAGMLDLIDEDWTLTDRRALALWEEMRGREGAQRIVESSFSGVREPQFTVHEVLACDDTVIAMRVAWSGIGYGGAQFSNEMGAVSVVRDGREVSMDVYDPDDRASMIARYVELGGGLGKLGDTAPERLFAEYARRYARRDLDGVVELMSDDYVQVDHRALGWHEIGKEQNAAEMRSVWAGTTDIRPEVEEVLAADDRVLACICTYRGSADAANGGGRFEYPVGFLFVREGQRSARVEWFEPDDRDAMLARYRELTSEVPEAVRLGMQIVASWNEHDVDRVMELYAEDIEFVDHRALGAEPLRGQEAVRELHRAAFEVFPDNIQKLDQVIAADDRVIAWRVMIRGTSPDAAGGEAEVPLGGVDLFEDGKLVSVDLFEPDDLAGIVKRYAELGGGQGPLGDRPPERFFAEFCRRWASGDVGQILDLYSSDYVNVDHRQVGWEEINSPKALREFVESAWATVTDLRCEVDEVLACDERVIALRTSWRGHSADTGGEFELKFGYVAVVENGLTVGQDHYDYDDTSGMLARYEELSRGRSDAERLVRRYLRLIERRDLDSLREVMSDEIEVADHRPVAAPPGKGPDAALELTRSALEVTSELRFEISDVIATNARTVALRGSWIGTAADGQGEMSLPMALVVDVEGDKVVALDLYEHGDLEAIRARAVGPAARVMLRFAELLNTRQLEEIRSLYADEFELVDHRPMPWENIAGGDQMIAILHETLTLAPDGVVAIEILDDDGGNVVGCRQTWSGTFGAGGPAELVMDGALVVRDEQFIRAELFNPDQATTMRGRLAELRAGG